VCRSGIGAIDEARFALVFRAQRFERASGACASWADDTGVDAATIGTLAVMANLVEQFIKKSPNWSEEMAALRAVLLKTGLTEDIKWAKPCYSDDGDNIAIMQPMKNFLALMFFKGALMADPKGVLESQGPNSRSANRMCIRSVADVNNNAATIRKLVAEAIAVEAQGLEAAPAPKLELVAELQARFKKDKALKAAFEGLTPGRQREYNLHFSNAKQAATRDSRIDKCVDQILAGKGLRDR